MVDGPGYRRDIDGLRAVAVLAVCVCHAGLPGVSGGFVGVDVFFVISGYLITGILAREAAAGTLSILGFYERRARRILPALLALLVVLLMAGLWLFPPFLYEDLATGSVATLAFVSNLWFWHETGDYFGSEAAFQPLLHTWSLGVEEQVYLVLPLLVWLFAGRRGALMGVLAGLSAVSFAAALWASAFAPDAGFYLTPFRIWEFGIGGMLALGVLPAPTRRIAGLASGAGLAAIVLPVIVYDAGTPFPGLAALPVALGAGALLWAGQSHGGLVTRGLSAAPLVAIGRISYSLYLWHWPPLAIAAALTGSADLPLALTLGLLALSCGLAWASWAWIEQPVRRHKARRAPVLASAAAASIALGLPAALIAQKEGLVSPRVAPEVLAAYDRLTRPSPIEEACRSTGVPQICGLGDAAAAPRLLVWGDSHAGTLLPGFDAWLAASGQGAVAAFKAACGPLAEVNRADQGPGHDCAGFNAAVLDWIEDHPQIETVVLAARWRLIVDGSRAPGEPGGAAVLAGTGALPPRPAAGNAGLAEAGLRATLARLEAAGRTVLIVDTVPEPGAHVPQLWLAAAYPLASSLGGWVDPKALDIAEHRARTQITDGLLQRVAADFAGVRILQVAEALCTPDCRTSIDGMPAYRDDDHLSSKAALWLVPRVMPAMVLAAPSAW